MSPIALDGSASSPATFTTTQTGEKLDPKLFPDGLKTSGKKVPRYDAIKPYEVFPTEITGETVWKAEDYADAPEKWTYRFNLEQLGELSDAADAFIASGVPRTGISRVSICTSRQESNSSSRNYSPSRLCLASLLPSDRH